MFFRKKQFLQHIPPTYKMKKTFLFAAAVAVLSAFTACSSEVEPVDVPVEEDAARLSLSITADNSVANRAVQQVDASKWVAKIGDEDWVAADALSEKTYRSDTYTVTVSNYRTEAEVYALNEEKGEAYYTLSKEVYLDRGNNEVEFACGKAKNSLVAVDWTGTGSVAKFVVNNVAAVQTVQNEDEAPEKLRAYTFTEKGEAYFYAGTDVVCTINYTYDGEEMTAVRTIAAPEAATKYALNIKANTRGSITVTITYDDEMGEGETTETILDAATGEAME